MESQNQIPVEYSAVEARLADMRSRLAGRVWDVTTGRGMDEAKRARAELRTARVSLEAARNTFKAPLLDACRRLDNEAKRITGEIVLLETPIDAVIKEEERRKEQARLERERVEKARMQAIVDRIQRLGARPAWGATLPDLEAAYQLLSEPLNPDEFGDLLAQAQAARSATMIWYEGAISEMQAELERRKQRALDDQERARQLDLEKLARHNAEVAAQEAIEQAAADREFAAQLRAEAEAPAAAVVPEPSTYGEWTPITEPPVEPQATAAPTGRPGELVRVFKVSGGRVSAKFIDEVESILSLAFLTDDEKIRRVMLIIEAVDWGTK